MATPDTRYDTVTQYLDWGDHTVTVDPNRGARWIDEGGDMLHFKDRNFLRRTNDESFKHAARALQSLDPPVTNPTRFNPTSVPQQFVRKASDAGATEAHSEKTPFDQWYCHRGQKITDERLGLYPAVMDRHRANDLGDITRDEAERATHADQAARTGRAFPAKNL
jgi:hypothetical protein